VMPVMPGSVEVPPSKKHHVPLPCSTALLL
jgi:hypothetical protein